MTSRILALLSDPIALPAVLALVAAGLRLVYAGVSRLVQPFPRARAAVEAVAALAPDVIRAALQVVAVLTGRPAPKLDLAPLDPATRRAAESSEAWRARAEAAEARVAELTAGEEPGTLRQTVVPGDDPPPSTRETTVRRRIVPLPPEPPPNSPDESTAGRDPSTRGAL